MILMDEELYRQGCKGAQGRARTEWAWEWEWEGEREWTGGLLAFSLLSL